MNRRHDAIRKIIDKNKKKYRHNDWFLRDGRQNWDSYVAGKGQSTPWDLRLGYLKLLLVSAERAMSLFTCEWIFLPHKSNLQQKIQREDEVSHHRNKHLYYAMVVRDV